MIELPTVQGGYACVLADPPWRFKVRSAKGLGRSADRHYATMTIADVCALPVRDIAARDCHLFLWVTGPHLVIGSHLEVMRAWGFKPTAMGFVWIKLKSDRSILRGITEADLAFGLGYTTRKNAEFCLIGRRGNPRRLVKDVREVIIAPAGAHSEKPAEVHRRIERYCSGARVELFARRAQAGWQGWGDEFSTSDATCRSTSRN
jgi:N6-adenosine-specific RNA methylase IME4